MFSIGLALALTFVLGFLNCCKRECEFERDRFCTLIRIFSSEERTIEGIPKVGIGLMGLKLGDAAAPVDPGDVGIVVRE